MDFKNFYVFKLRNSFVDNNYGVITLRGNIWRVIMNKDELISKVEQLIQLYRNGKLGGEKMPEDENPMLEKNSLQNYLYFTLPMALNYQRNSYKLWECSNKSYLDNDIKDIFNPATVLKMSDEELKFKLTKYKVALQPNKQPIIWKTLCNTFMNKFDGDLRELFYVNGYSIKNIKDYINDNKKGFPYLGGNKIMNYWLYVMEQYTDLKFVDRENITVAPDTHIIQASEKLGVITEAERNLFNIQEIVADKWSELLKDTELFPIDIHTPMWLWSRGKFNVKLG